MLHNLKRTIISTRNGYFGGNMQSTTTNSMCYAIYRCLSNSTSAQIKCWSCGSVKKSTSIEFKCSKCQSLLDLPKNLVNKWVLIVSTISNQTMLIYLGSFRIVKHWKKIQYRFQNADQSISANPECSSSR